MNTEEKTTEELNREKIDRKRKKSLNRKQRIDRKTGVYPPQAAWRLAAVLMVLALTGCGNAGKVTQDILSVSPEPVMDESGSAAAETNDDQNGQQDAETSLSENEEETEQEASEGESLILEAVSEKGTYKDSVYQQTEIMEYSLEMPELALEGVTPRTAELLQAFWEEEQAVYEVEKKTSYWQADDAYHDWLIWEESYEGEASMEPVWGYGLSYSIEQVDEQYISLSKMAYTYSGGAHGLSTVTGCVLDAKTGEELSLDDFLPGGEEDRPYLAAYLIEQLSQSEYAADFWQDYDDTVLNRICSDPIFYIKDNKLVFIFNQYELASYAMGIQSAEIPLEKLGDLKNAVEDKEWAEIYVMRQQNPYAGNDYLVELSAGETYFADLDGDGEKEEILLPTDGVVDNSAIRLLVNGMSYEFYIDSNVIGNYIGLMDLNEADGKYELAVYADGPSWDPVTVFFRYQGGVLYEIGRAETIVDKEAMNTGRTYTLGTGSIYGAKMIYTPLETRTISTIWTLDAETDQVRWEETDYYSFLASSAYGTDREEFPYYLLDSVVLYEEPSRDSAYTVISGEDNRILGFLGTDGKNWVQVHVLEGEKLHGGWIYVEDFQVETQKDVLTTAFEVITNLSQAG